MWDYDASGFGALLLELASTLTADLELERLHRIQVVEEVLVFGDRTVLTLDLVEHRLRSVQANMRFAIMRAE